MFIKLSDGILIEVETPPGQAQPISSAPADRVGRAIGVIKPLLTKVAKPVHEAVMDIQTDMPVESAELEINLGFTAEGNVYITKLQSSSSLKVKLVLKPKV